MKKQVMTLAHAVKTFFSDFSDALRAAWIIVKLRLGRAVRVAFAKETGEIREALAIGGGSTETVERGFYRFIERTDVGGEQWRSFRIERLVF